jgi:cleavage stimulation factor subunit 3
VGSSDDEEDDDATPTAVPYSAQGTSSQSRPAVPPSFQVSTSGFAETGAGSLVSQVNNAVPDSVTSATMSPTKTRNPLDVLGTLEDRVKEDPRGDMDAWLALIADHRRRNKFDDLRGVYNRFLEIFPQAVGDTALELRNRLTGRRPTSGWNTLRWNSRSTT